MNVKRGGLDFLRVHKFKLSNQEVLLGYMYEEDEIILTLLKLAPHENFYRGIKNNIQSSFIHTLIFLMNACQ
ncbi:type II toxin-antitoxin system RelE/ParE family toxin [Fluoribacter gormanii]|uniref:type II toxin-antitoxin system RelE/ParE family toxin n=1 Tax=Fluoribacter gormanii TaxID=464 RepID=UPI001A944486